MTIDVPSWSIRSVVVSVRDLDRSSSFYQDVMNLRELARENRVAVLSADPTGSFTVFLRQAYSNAVRPGDQALGVRSLSCNVGSLVELDRVEARLKALNAFQNRRFVDEAERFEMVHGHDPDRLSLVFVATDTNLPLEDYNRALVLLHAIDM
jgi:catechol 2,3-dioxygenase-like lactoylglutathione lyase family enzyme